MENAKQIRPEWVPSAYRQQEIQPENQAVKLTAGRSFAKKVLVKGLIKQAVKRGA